MVLDAISFRIRFCFEFVVVLNAAVRMMIMTMRK